jgi:hypothetical protein
MSEFFGALDGGRNGGSPWSFLLAGNANGLAITGLPLGDRFFLCIMTLNLRRQLLKRQRELARERGTEEPWPRRPVHEFEHQSS